MCLSMWKVKIDSLCSPTITLEHPFLDLSNKQVYITLWIYSHSKHFLAAPCTISYAYSSFKIMSGLSKQGSKQSGVCLTSVCMVIFDAVYGLFFSLKMLINFTVTVIGVASVGSHMTHWKCVHNIIILCGKRPPLQWAKQLNYVHWWTYELKSISLLWWQWVIVYSGW